MSAKIRQDGYIGDMMDVRIVSIGTMAANPLWNEKSPVRTGHATCTLVRAEEKAILVDPGLPGQVMAARLGERAGLTSGDISHVFLTSFRPETMRGLAAFENSTWWIHEPEREGVGIALAMEARRAAESGDHELGETLAKDIALIRACEVAPDVLAAGVSLFPLPGVSAGMCGLILSEPLGTTVICGDAVATVEHLEQGKVITPAADVDQARESFAEVVEIADWVIPGRDNLVANRGRRGPF